MTGGSSAGALKQTNWAARVFWGVSAIFVVIGGGMEAYVYFAFTDRNLWTWVGIAEALARAICTQAIIMVLTLAGVKLWQSGAHAFWKTVLFIFFQFIAVLAATHGFVLVWVAAVAFRRGDLLGNADQGIIDIPFLGTFQLSMIVLTLIAAMPYYEVILSLIGPIVTKERRALSPEEIEEMNRREEAMGRYNATKAKNLAATAMNLRNAGAAFITGKMDEPVLATNTPSDDEGNSGDLSSEMGVQNITTFPGNSTGSRQTGRGASGGRGLPATHVKAEGILKYVHDELRRTDVTISDVKAWLVQQPKASPANKTNADNITLVGAPYVIRKSTAFAAARTMWPPQEMPVEIAD